MSFLGNVPTYVNQLEREIKQLNIDRRTIDWGHDCDCEYCDRRGDGGEDAQERADAIDKQIREHERMIKRLQRYVEMFVR